jgi:hypothetical protein
VVALFAEPFGVDLADAAVASRRALDCPLVLRQRRIRHFPLNGRGVMEKKSEKAYRQYPVGFQKDALERMKHCDDIRALAAELGVSRGALYLWKRKAEGRRAYGKGSARGNA